MQEPTRDRILLVEDDLERALIFRSVLEVAGFLVHIELDGVRALRYAAHHHSDLIILEAKLPDMDGLWVCQEVRNLCADWVIPALVLTAPNGSSDLLEQMTDGATLSLANTCEPIDILKAISLLLSLAQPALS